MTRLKTLSALFATGLGAFIICCRVTAVCQSVSHDDKSYFPLSVGNSWVYSLKERSQALKKITWRVTQREVVHEIPVFHLWQIPTQNDEPLSLSEVETGIVESSSERFLLKKPLRTGDRWSTKSQGLRNTVKLDAFEVITAGKTCSVGKYSFRDCTTIREIDEANNVASLTTYARGVGPIKYIYFKGLHSEEVDTTLTLKSWQVR